MLCMLTERPYLPRQKVDSAGLRLNGENSGHTRMENTAIVAHLERRHIAEGFRYSTESSERTFFWNKGNTL